MEQWKMKISATQPETSARMYLQLLLPPGPPVNHKSREVVCQAISIPNLLHCMSQNREGDNSDVHFLRRGDTKRVQNNSTGAAKSASTTKSNEAEDQSPRSAVKSVAYPGATDGNNWKIANPTASKGIKTPSGSGSNSNRHTKTYNDGHQNSNNISANGATNSKNATHKSNRSAGNCNENQSRGDNINRNNNNNNNNNNNRKVNDDNNMKNRNNVNTNNNNNKSNKKSNNDNNDRNKSSNNDNSYNNHNNNYNNYSSNYNNNHNNNDNDNNRNNSRNCSKSNNFHSNNNSHNSNYRNSYKSNDHSAYEPPGYAANNRTKNPSIASPDQSRFWERLRNYMRNMHTTKSVLPVDMNSRDDCRLWLQAWAAAASDSGSAGDHNILPAIMLRLPDTEVLMPAADDVINVLCNVVSSFDSEEKKAANTQHRREVLAKGISSLETVLDVIRDRLMGKLRIIGCSMSVASSVDLLTAKFTTVVSIFFSTDFSDRAFTLVSRVKEIKDYQTFILEVGIQEVHSAVTTDMSSEGWTSPSVGWLMSGTWHKVNKLKTEYKNAEEYTETLKQIWTLLTFYWGAAAVWPKCKHRQQGDGVGGEDKMCGEPLLALSKAGKEGRCSYKRGSDVCGNISSWKCHKGLHYEICSSCLAWQQEQLVGPPSIQASTDIYDAVVDRETTRKEGTLFVLSGLKSRKPPAIDPNWMTTYRLQPAALVAVIRLGASNQRLTRDLQIQWAEVVSIDQKEEWKARRNGCITLRLLTSGDCSTLSTESDLPLDSHTRVAIIDLRVFVPEVVSVLATLAGKDFCKYFSQIPFKDRLLGIPSAPSTFNYLPEASVVSNIINALNNSEIEFVLRLDGQGRSALANLIYAIPQVQTLYGTQLEAFTAALSSSAHCTQGPPGTGKSYIGVCLVLALDVIRARAQSSGTPVGPVLLLSYKNHALDEFLSDVIKFSPHHMGRIGNLIRTGKPEREELQKYSEKHSAGERDAQNELNNRILVQRNSRKKILEWRRIAQDLRDRSMQVDTTRPCPPHNDLLLSVRRALQLLSGVGGWNNLAGGSSTEPLSASALPTVPIAYQLIQRATRPTALMTNENNLIPDTVDLHKALPLISSGLEHWAAKDDERLGVWLRGSLPPPRCGAFDMSVQCLQVVNCEGALCNLFHKCLSQYTRECRGQRQPFLAFCKSHACQHLKCTAERMPTSLYCSLHSCPCCIGSNRKGEAIGDTLPYACHRHQCKVLLRADEKSMSACNKPALLPHSYCIDHCCQECGESGSVPGRPRTGQSMLCLLHKCQIGPCNLIRYGSARYCSMHICSLCAVEADPSSAESTCMDSALCESHKCAQAGCLYARLSAPIGSPQFRMMTRSMATSSASTTAAPASTESISPYCKDHTCRKCFLSTAPCNLPVEDVYPRNVCMAHTLCSFISKGGYPCSSLLVFSSVLYCAKHELEAKEIDDFIFGDGLCCGFTRRHNRRCRTVGTCDTGGEWWCLDHISQKPDQNVIIRRAYDFDDDVIQDDGYDIAVSGRVMSVPLKGTQKLVKHPKLSSIRCQHNVLVTGNQCNVREWVASTVNTTWFCCLHAPSLKSTSPPGPRHGDFESPMNCSVEQKELSHAFPPPSTKETFIKEAPKVQQNSVAQSSAAEKCNDLKEAGPRRPPRQGKGSQIMPVHSIREGDLHAPQEKALVAGGPAITVRDEDRDGDRDQDDDDFDFIEGNAVAMHPDEMDFVEVLDASDDGEQEEELEGNDELRRLNELDAHDSDSDKSSYDGDGGAEAEADEGRVKIANIAVELTDPSLWSWDMPPATRYRSAAALLYTMGAVVNTLRQISHEHVSLARRLRADAGCEAFKKARLVAATVVGASRRLEAIRAAEPFAVVVEEACEVMEPTLISVLAVKSLRKLELIGDHRQLPAFIQNCWFNLECTLPSIKTSLFERLISSVSSRDGRSGTGALEQPSAVPHTVLDEQRRMRSSIADITRPHYSDVVTITDHVQTSKQLIGDAALLTERPRLRMHRALWGDRPRGVPGIRPTVFFWDLADNKESRPMAGLSACNEMEADAATELTKWFLLCGVPPSSISVITPYKGQKTLIIKKLRAAKCLPSFKDTSPPVGSTVNVSTVDRYQGDENDIIIYSNVRIRPGNKFVVLKNRFIVATSRARMGFYIIGSVDAVLKGPAGKPGPPHWVSFVEQLRQTNHREAEEDINLDPDGTWTCYYSDEDNSVLDIKPPTPPKSDCTYNGSRVGPSLPICCPRHHTTMRVVRDVTKFPTQSSWAQFCKEPCGNTLLLCGHGCALPCHSPTSVKHTVQAECTSPLERSCKAHSHIPLLCKELSFGRGDTIATALLKSDCQIREPYRRPECDHIINLPCHLLKCMESEPKPAIAACSVIVNDFIQPGCGHIIKAPTCFNRRKYEAEPPPCKEKVRHERTCGCSIVLTCEDNDKERANPTQCMSSMTTFRPRCFHPLSVRCHLGTTLHTLWSQQNGEAVKQKNPKTIVEYGVSYGPSEKDLLGARLTTPICSTSSTYRASCGHLIGDIPCDKAFDYAAGRSPEPVCDSDVTFLSPLCGHSVTVPCWARRALTEWMPWGQWGKPEQIFEDALLKAGTAKLPMKVMKVLRNICAVGVQVHRLCGRDHLKRVPCGDLYLYLTEGKRLPICEEVFNRPLPCGHPVRVKCHQCDDPYPECKMPVQEIFGYPCGEHTLSGLTCGKLTHLKTSIDPKCPNTVTCTRYLCGHSVRAACHLKPKITEHLPGEHLLPVAERIGQQVVVADTLYCSPARYVDPCVNQVTYCFPCGHYRPDVRCCDAFFWAANTCPDPCIDQVPLMSPLCGHSIKVACPKSDLVRRWRPWQGGRAEAEEEIGGHFLPPFETVADCDEHGQTVSQIVVKHDGIQPSAAIVPVEELQCDGRALMIRDCGHSKVMHCAEAFYRTSRPCVQIVTEDCPKPSCKFTRNYPCSKYQEELKSGLKQCRNMIPKLCVKCGVNSKLVECFKEEVQCQTIVKVALSCEHEVTWRCDSENDPRLDPPGTLNCLACVIATWKRSSSNREFTGTTSSILESFNGRISHRLESLSNVIVKDSLRVINLVFGQLDLNQHLDSRRKLQKGYLDMLAVSKNSMKGKYTLPPPQAGDPDFLLSYDLVFKEMKDSSVEVERESEQNKLRKQFASSAVSKYGFGNRLFLLTEDSLRKQKPSNDGILRICVGLAFRHRCLEDTPQFRVGDTPAEILKANQQSQIRMKAGYDCVDVTIAGNGATGPSNRIYWYGMTAIPLQVVSLKLHSECSICGDYYAAGEGLCCSKKHLICWECLESYIGSVSAPGAIAGLIDDVGNVKCPVPGCTDRYVTQHVIDSKGTAEVIGKLEDLRKKAHGIKEAQAARDQLELEWRLEKERIAKIKDLDERKAHEVRQRIVEDILCLRCPRCKAVFNDFEGCFALTCGRSNCRAGFCAWCLVDCGRDAHAHVLTCPEGQQDYYGTRVQFEAHHRAKRIKTVEEIVGKEDEKVREILRRILAKDLKDL